MNGNLRYERRGRKGERREVTSRMNFLRRQERRYSGLESKVTKKLEVREKRRETVCGDINKFSSLFSWRNSVEKACQTVEMCY